MNTKTSFLILAAAGFILAGCSKSSPPSTSPGTNAVSQTATTATNTAENATPASGNYLGGVMQADKYAVKTIDVASINQAIQQFNAAEGRNPQTLQELVPNYLPKIPAAPYGYQIVYDPKAGTAKVVQVQP